MASIYSYQQVSRRAAQSRMTAGVRQPAIRVELLEDRLAPSTTIPISGVDWTPIGPSPITATTAGTGTVAPNNLPTGGRVLGVSADPTLPNTFYAATGGGGVAQTTDGGTTWTHLTDNLPGLTNAQRTLAMSTIAVNPIPGNQPANSANAGAPNSQIIFAGQGDNTFSQYSFAGRGLLRSLDGGQNWDLIEGPIQGASSARAFTYGAVVKIVYHPTDPNIMFVLMDGNHSRYGVGGRPNAVWRTTNALDANPTWTDISQQLPQASQPSFTVSRTVAFTDFSIDPSNPEIGYLTLGEPGGYNLNGIYRTEKAVTGDPTITDLTQPNSVRWTPRLGGTSNFAPGLSNPLGIIKMEAAPGRPSTLYAVLTSAGGGMFAIFKSTDSGVNWVNVLQATTPGPGNTGAAFTNPGAEAISILIDPTPNTDNRVFVAGRNGIALTEDGGLTWRNVSNDPAGDGPQRVILDMQFDANKRVLAATNGGVFRLNVWQNQAPLDWVSVNGQPGPAGPDTGPNGNLSGGLGATQFFFNGIPPSAEQYRQANLPLEAADNIIATTWRNGTVNFTDPGGFNANAAPLYGWPGTDTRVENGGNVIYDFLSPNVVYHTGSGSNYVQKSTDGGRTWNTSNAGIAGPIWTDPSPPMEIDPSANRRLYFGTDRVYVTNDAAASWAQFQRDLPYVTGLGPVVTKIGVGRQDGRFVYAAVSDRIDANGVSHGPALYMWNPFYRASDNANYWLDVTPTRNGDPRMPPDPDSPWSTSNLGPPNSLGGQITDITVDPVDSQVLYVTVEKNGVGRVWRSTRDNSPGGFGGILLSWTDITGDLPAPTNGGFRPYSNTVDPNKLGAPFGFTDDDVYIGTEVGLWKLTNPINSTSWTRVGAITDPNDPTNVGSRELPDVMVRDVKLDTSQGILSIATFGRGIWQYQIRPYVSGFAFEDLNGNGVRNSGEPPISGVKVVAVDTTTNAEIANTTTRSDGFYVFGRGINLEPGTYRIEIRNNDVSGVQPVQQTSPPLQYTVTSKTTITDGNIGVFIKPTISGVKFDDLNGDGVRQTGEPGLAGWTIELRNSATDALIATTTTGVDGSYLFNGVTGDLGQPALQDRSNPFDPVNGYPVVPYKIVEVNKTGWQQTRPTPVPPGSYSRTLTSRTPSTGNDFGNFQLVTISGVAFEDINGNGTQDPSDAGLTGWTIELRDKSNTVIATQTTGLGGAYSFANVGPGQYTITEQAKSGWGVVASPAGPFATVSGVNRSGSNFGNFRYGTISGAVFEDTNGDGVRQITETTPIIGATVALIDPRTNTTALDPVTNNPLTATTDNSGAYSFTGLLPLLRPGNTVPYLARVLSPLTAYAQTSADRSVTLNSGATAAGQDLGLFQRTSISGFGFEDTNGNGTRDTGEPALANFTVSLLNANTGGVVATTQTDANGNYTFANLGPLQQGGPGGPVVGYRIGVTTTGWYQTTPNPGDIFLNSSTPVTGVTFGAFRGAVFTGTTYNDLNGNGVRDAGEAGLQGWTVSLISAATGTSVGTAVSDASGNYSITVGPGTYAVREVGQANWVQTSTNPVFRAVTSGLVVGGQDFGNFRRVNITGNTFADLNGNGVQESGESSLAGWQVQLLDGSGNVLDNAFTDANGIYGFANLGPGTFRVREIPQSTWFVSTQNPVTVATTSGVNPVVNFGNFQTAAVRVWVFEDLDQSGSYDAGEPASEGWTAQLVNGSGVVIATAVTDSSGFALFPSVPAGTFTVSLAGRDGWQQTTSNTAAFTISSGQSIFAGAIGTIRFGSISGSVYIDGNRNFRRDSWESAAPNLTVGLFNGDNVLVDQQSPDSNGFYNFVGLPAGLYNVRLLNPPTNLSTTSPRGASQYTVSVSIGSVNAGNSNVGDDFGVIGRKRFAVAADGGGGPRVQIFDAASGGLLQNFFVYEESFTGGVRVAEADVNGDGIDDLVVVAGPGGGPRVRVIDGITGNTVYDFFVYEPSFRDGMYIAAGDVDGDGYADLVTGTAPGGGPRVAVFSGRTGDRLADFFAYDSSFRGGVRVGAGDLNNDGKAEVITGTGPGGAPIVRVWNAPNFQQISSFLAYDSSFTGGIYVAGGGLQTNGRADLLVGTGAGYSSARVRGFDQSGRQTFDNDAFPTSVKLNTTEVRVSSVDRNGDGTADIVIAAGKGNPPLVRTLDGRNRRQIGDVNYVFEATFLGGVFIG